MELPRTAVAVLESCDAEEWRSIEELAATIDEPPETVTRAAFELADEGLVSVESETESTATLTAEGESYLDEGLPEVRLYTAVLDLLSDASDGAASVAIGDAVGVAGLDGQAVDVALSNFPRKYGAIEEGAIRPDPSADPDGDPEARALTAVADGAECDADTLDRLASRGLAELEEHTSQRVRRTEDGDRALDEGVEVADGVGQVTPALLSGGDWQDTDLRAYNVAADADPVHGGRTHVLRAMAERVTDVLVGMGFEEMQGPHVDAQFWINDCLFMPQDHPARTHWDQFALDAPDAIDDLPDDLVDRVREAHRTGVGEDGSGYHSPWDEDVARDLDLRGHTTSLTMRHLAGVAEADVEAPARFFSVEKAYRNDTIDATHLLEFFQIEGWVLADELSVRDLMGTFEEFYAQFGITDLEFKPHYNPYTEPSFELFGEHPETGELIEIGNSGLFRDEVLEPLGVEGDVMAWGLALERLAMLTTGAEDIRDLHGTLADLDFLRHAEVTY
jgi:phenylalanyl-tRNA synthetase alpha chain